VAVVAAPPKTTEDPRVTRLAAIEKEIKAASQAILDSIALRRAAEKDLVEARGTCIKLEVERARLEEAMRKDAERKLQAALNPNASKDTGFKVPLYLKPPAPKAVA
jgi:hypothetical protein